MTKFYSQYYYLTMRQRLLLFIKDNLIFIILTIILSAFIGKKVTFSQYNPL
jgi:hypothetical protein